MLSINNIHKFIITFLMDFYRPFLEDFGVRAGKIMINALIGLHIILMTGLVYVAFEVMKHADEMEISFKLIGIFVFVMYVLTLKVVAFFRLLDKK